MSKDAVGRGEAGGLSRPPGHTGKEAESSTRVLGEPRRLPASGLTFGSRPFSASRETDHLAFYRLSPSRDCSVTRKEGVETKRQ